MNITLKLVMAISVSLLLMQQAAHAQLQSKDWKIIKQHNSIMYTPVNGDHFFYMVFDPVKMKPTQKKKDLLFLMLNKMENSFKEVPKWKISEEKNSEWSASASTVYRGDKTYVTLKTESLPKEKVFMVSVFGDVTVYEKYSKSYNNIVGHAKKVFEKKIPLTSKSSNKE